MQNFQVMFGDNYPNAAVFGTDANGSTVTIMVTICCGRFASTEKNISSTLVYHAMLLAYPQSDVQRQYYNMPNTTILRDSVSGASTLNNVGLFIDNTNTTIAGGVLGLVGVGGLSYIGYNKYIDYQMAKRWRALDATAADPEDLPNTYFFKGLRFGGGSCTSAASSLDR